MKLSSLTGALRPAKPSKMRSRTSTRRVFCNLHRGSRWSFLRIGTPRMASLSCSKVELMLKTSKPSLASFLPAMAMLPGCSTASYSTHIRTVARSSLETQLSILHLRCYLLNFQSKFSTKLIIVMEANTNSGGLLVRAISTSITHSSLD